MHRHSGIRRLTWPELCQASCPGDPTFRRNGPAWREVKYSLESLVPQWIGFGFLGASPHTARLVVTRPRGDSNHPARPQRFDCQSGASKNRVGIRLLPQRRRRRPLANAWKLEIIIRLTNRQPVVGIRPFRLPHMIFTSHAFTEPTREYFCKHYEIDSVNIYYISPSCPKMR